MGNYVFKCLDCCRNLWVSCKSVIKGLVSGPKAKVGWQPGNTYFLSAFTIIFSLKVVYFHLINIFYLLSCQIDTKLGSVPEYCKTALIEVINTRRDEIRLQLAADTNGISQATLQDFDWEVKVKFLCH